MLTANKNRRTDNVQDQVFWKVAFAILSLPRKFLNNIEFSQGGCWNWAGSRRYSLVNGVRYEYGTYSNKLAHRLSFFAAGKKLASGLELDHLCQNKLCVNPQHLEAVTHKENCRRRPKSGPVGGYRLQLVNGKRKMVRP